MTKERKQVDKKAKAPARPSDEREPEPYRRPDFLRDLAKVSKPERRDSKE